MIIGRFPLSTPNHLHTSKWLLTLGLCWVGTHGSICFGNQQTMALCLLLSVLWTKTHFFFLMVENISKEEKYFGILENYTKCKLQSAQWFNCATAVLFYFLLACCLWLPVCSCNTGVAPNTEWATKPKIFMKYWHATFAHPWFIPIQHTSVLNENLLT